MSILLSMLIPILVWILLSMLIQVIMLYLNVNSHSNLIVNPNAYAGPYSRVNSALNADHSHCVNPNVNSHSNPSVNPNVNAYPYWSVNPTLNADPSHSVNLNVSAHSNFKVNPKSYVDFNLSFNADYNISDNPKITYCQWEVKIVGYTKICPMILLSWSLINVYIPVCI